MFSRISKVDSITAKVISFSACLHIGDCSYIDGDSRVLAIQQRSDLIFLNEPNFKDFSIFSSPTIFPLIDEEITITINNPNPFIRVGKLKFIGITASSVVNIGNTDHIRMRTRIKHIRYVSPNDYSENSIPTGIVTGGAGSNALIPFTPKG